MGIRTRRLVPLAQEPWWVWGRTRTLVGAAWATPRPSGWSLLGLTVTPVGCPEFGLARG